MNIERELSGHTFIARHSIKGDGMEEYEGLSREGVALAKEKAETELLNIIQSAPDRAVIFIGGISDAPRTKSTAKAFGEQLKAITKNNKNILVINKPEIDAMGGQSTQEKDGIPFNAIQRATQKVKTLIHQHPREKIVLDYPLRIRELSLDFKRGNTPTEGRWRNTKGDTRDYFVHIMKKHHQNHDAAAAEWIATGGKLEFNGEYITGPNPQEVAEEYIDGINRLHRFVQKHIQDRPCVIGIVGHGFDMAAVLTYLSNNGVVNDSGLQKITQGEMVHETDIIEVAFQEERKIIRYHGREFSIT